MIRYWGEKQNLFHDVNSTHPPVFTIDPATWAIQGYQVPVPSRLGDMMDGRFILSRRIREQQLRILMNPAIGGVPDNVFPMWADLLANHFSMKEGTDRRISYFLIIELMKWQQDARSVSLFPPFGDQGPQFPESVLPLAQLEFKLFKTLRFGNHVDRDQCQLRDFRIHAALVVQYVLTTVRLYFAGANVPRRDENEFWKLIFEKLGFLQHPRCDFFMRSLRLLRLRDLKITFPDEVDMLEKVVKENANRMVQGHKLEFRARLTEALAQG
jgi:hypothetical protein